MFSKSGRILWRVLFLDFSCLVMKKTPLSHGFLLILHVIVLERGIQFWLNAFIKLIFFIVNRTL